MRATLPLIAVLILAASPSADAQAPEAIANKTLVVTWPGIDFPMYVFVTANGRIYHHHTDPTNPRMVAGGSEYTIGKTERADTFNDVKHLLKRHSETTAGWAGRTLTLRNTSYLFGVNDPIKGRPSTFTYTFNMDGETCTAHRRVAGPGDHKSADTATSCKVVAGNQMPGKQQ
jgi:hypothetical protein